MIVEVYSAPGRPTGDRVLGFLRAYTAAHGGATPSQREIADGLSLGLSTVWQALLILEAAGQITRSPGARTIQLVVPPDGPGDPAAHTGKRLHG